MSALARYFNTIGINVSGYDRTKTKLTAELENENINIHYTPDINKIEKNIDIVIYTPAVKSDNIEFQYFKNSGIRIIKRAEMVAELVNSNYCIAISGTHGKTTISSLITHILKHANKEILAFVGGIMKNYNKNIIFSINPEYSIIEADEYDKSFLQLTPDIAVISSIDPDHLDIYDNYNNYKNAFSEFASKIKVGGKLICNEQTNLNIKNINFYGINSKKGINARNIIFNDKGYFFDVYDKDKCKIKNISFPYGGLHNIENALAAINIALHLEINEEDIKNALSTFKGINRRFDLRINNNKIKYIDDYAHHPKEIETLINSVKKLYPDKKITGIFQPHLYSRTRDLADEFAISLEGLDNIIIMDIYPAREEPIEGINADFLLNKIRNNNKYNGNDLYNTIKKIKPEILLTIGAGNIDLIVPEIEKLLINMIKENIIWKK